MESTVTLDRLYRAKTNVTLPGGVVVQVRALSDAERRSKQQSAIRASLRLEQAFNDPESDAYIVHIMPLEKSERDELVEIYVAWAQNDAVRQAPEVIKDEYIPLPEKATEQDIKDTMQRRDKSEDAIANQRRAYVQERAEVARKKAQEMPDADLRREAIARRKYLTALEQALIEDSLQTVLVCTEKDGQPFFADIEEVKNLDSRVLDALLTEQRKVDSLDPWAVAKFRNGRIPRRMVGTRKKPKSKSR